MNSVELGIAIEGGVVRLQQGNKLPTLRDMFAMAALQALGGIRDVYYSTSGEAARDAYKLADAMLRAREE